MRSYLQFITTPTSDTPGTLLLLHFDNKRYLIGHVAEGTQRACIQRGISLRKVSDIFLTGRTEWANTGGLLGLILTAADSKESAIEAITLQENLKVQNKIQNGDHNAKPSASTPNAREENLNFHLNLYGSPNLEHTIATARRFVFRKGLPLKTTEYAASDMQMPPPESIAPTWSDDNIRVYALSLLPSQESNRPAAPRTRKRSFEEANGEATTLNRLALAHSGADSARVTGTISSVDAEISDSLSHAANGPQAWKSYQDPKYKQMRRAVVSDMFDSDWNLDTLIETPLSKAHLPATLYVRNPITKSLEEYNGPLPGSSEEVPDITVLVRNPWPSALIKDLPPTAPATEAVSYIIRNHPQRGRFLAEKAEEFGIRDRKRGELARGNAVYNESGDLITPEMVLEPGKQGAGVAIVDLPTQDYIDAFISRPEWGASEVMEGVGAFIWILGPGVSSDLRLQRFQQERSQLLHILSSSDHSPDTLSLESAATAAIRHSLLDPQIFSVPIHERNGQGDLLDPSAFVQARPGRGLGLEPRIEIRDGELVKAFDASTVEAEIYSEVLPLKEDHLYPSKAELADFSTWSQTIPSSDAEIITLGTGSALPSKYRNVSGTLVRVPGCGSYLFDCGENTLGTLKRLYSPAELKDVLQDLKMIWISHLHADHHLGTTSIIKAWYHAVHNGIPADAPLDISGTEADADTPILAVVSDAPMLHWLYEYSSVEDYGYSRILPVASKPVQSDEELPAHGSTLRIAAYPTDLSLQSVNVLSPGIAANVEPGAENSIDISAILKMLNLTCLATVYVSHCRGAQAVSVTFKSGLKVSYSGDCRPSFDKFGRIGRDSHVLIHEATFEDELLGDAKAKKHSTVSEALGVARAMNAKACVLTHFSQRYQKVPLMSEEANFVTPNDVLNDGPQHIMQEPRDGPGSPLGRLVYVVAFDYMRVKIRDLPRLENLLPLLNKVYTKLDSNEKPVSTEQLKDVVGAEGETDAQPQSKRQKKKQAERERRQKASA